MLRVAVLAVLCMAPYCVAAAADDYGSTHAVRAIVFDATRLLAHRMRRLGIDPKAVAIRDVVASGDQALLSWDATSDHGVMGLVHHDNRWWVTYLAAGRPGGHWHAMAFPPMRETWAFTTALPSVAELRDAGFDPILLREANAHNGDVRAATTQNRAIHSFGDQVCVLRCGQVLPGGGAVHSAPDETAGYDVHIVLSKNSLTHPAAITQLYARAPTSAEMLPNPAPPRDWSGPTAVGFFDLDIGAAHPVTFADGTAIDIWFPFVLDDRLTYSMVAISDGRATPMINGRLFDNTLHFVLPSFVLVPGTPLTAEIDAEL